MKKRGISTVLSLILVMCFAMPVSVAASTGGEAEERAGGLLRYTNVVVISAELDINSSGKSTSYGRVQLANSTDTVDLILELQQRDNGTWSTIKDWSTSGSRTVSLEKDWYVLSGYSYRVRVTAKVYNSSGTLVETASLYSRMVTYN